MPNHVATSAYIHNVYCVSICSYGLLKFHDIPPMFAYSVAYEIGQEMKHRNSPGQLLALNLKSLKDGWHADGGNLYLCVRGASRTWVFRYVDFMGKRRHMGLGPSQSLSLAEARKTAAQLREQ